MPDAADNDSTVSLRTRAAAEPGGGVGVTGHDGRDFRRDDHDDFAERFAEHRPRLKQMLQFRMDPRLRIRTDLSDVLQEVYIEAHHRWDHEAGQPAELSFYLWLRQVTMQRMIDLHRRHLIAAKRDIRREVPLAVRGFSGSASAAMARHFVDVFGSPSQMVVRQEMLALLESSLESMDQIDREVLALRHFEELGNNEVAELLGISEAAASNRYVRALSRLRKLLEQIPDFFDGE